MSQRPRSTPSSKPIGRSSLPSGLELDDMRRFAGMPVTAGGVATGPELCSEPTTFVDDPPAEFAVDVRLVLGVPLAPVMLPAD